MNLASVIGYQKDSRWGNRLRVVPLGFVQSPTRPGGYSLAMATGFGRFRPECVGGAVTIELCAQMLREKAGFPAFLPGRHDGDITRL